MQKIRGYILDPHTGLTVADLTGNVVTVEEFRKCVSKFLGAVGVSTPSVEQKRALNELFASIKEDRWTAAHLEEVAKWMIRNHKYQRTSVADWYGAEVVKVYPEAWYKRQLLSGAHAQDFEWYMIDDVLVCKEQDGIDIPFEKVSYKAVLAKRAEEVLASMSNDYDSRSGTPTPVGTVIQRVKR